MTFDEEIKEFDKNFKTETIEVASGSFKCIYVGKENDKALVFLNGGLNELKMWYKYIQELSKEYKVLAFDYSQDFLDNQTQALKMNELFKKLGINKPILIGASFGGLMAQIYTQKFKDEIGGLILMSTAAMSQETLKSLSRKKPLAKILLWYIKHCNYDKAKIKMQSMGEKYAKDEGPKTKEYVNQMFSYIFKDYTKEKDYHITSLLYDLFTQPYVTSDTFKNLKDKILLILPRKDYFSKKMQDNLINLTGNTKPIYVDGGHIETVLDVEGYLKIIKPFLTTL